MQVILVDDEPLSLDLFKIECGNMPGFDVAGCFDSASAALSYAQTHPVDFALLDIDMPEMTGIELSRRLRLIHPDIVVIFVTAHPEFSAEAIHAKADFVVFKPYEREDILDALERARLLGGRRRKRVFFRTFGYFDMFLDGRVVSFRSAKAKELLALCVSRLGGEVTIYEMVETLWAETGDKGLGYRTTIKALSDMLKELGVGDMLLRRRSTLRLDVDAFDCDLQDYLSGRPDAVAAFRGEFMQQYAWAQEIGSRLGKTS